MFGGGVADFFVGMATAGLVQALSCLLERFRLGEMCIRDSHLSEHYEEEILRLADKPEEEENA